MTHIAGMEALDSLSMTDIAVQRTKERFPATDADAMHLVLLLHRVANVLTYDLESAVHRPRGLSWPAFRLLFTIWVGGELESKAAAAQSGMSRAAVSSLVNTLDNLGFIQRTSDAQDKRKILLSLTATGRSTLEDALQANNVQEQKWAQNLTRDDLQALIGLLSKLGQTAQSEWVTHRD
ncbi:MULTISPECIES: MarR family winged helix-turn-helix transcriptional regulator [unclassified Arthrobacter]|uniref:MarR family winged helix-turn-helix transcriptional regulator n=1 Tax=unclassified Arthrobacter TaxID=235627 RepID=UPI0036724B84